MKQCVKITVSGKVQGVAYREFVQKHARNLGIEGSVQNMDDKKTVVVNACGNSESLDEFIDFLYEGPNKSEVTDVQVEPIVKTKNFRGVFRIIVNQ